VSDITGVSRKYCREWAESKFSKKKMITDYINTYRKILGQ